MWSEIKRKLFHLSGLIYVLGLIYIPRNTYLWILAAMTAVFFTFEQMRLRHPRVRSWFEMNFGGLLRESERNCISGTFWMLEGVFLTVALLEPVSLAATAILYLLFGDTAASLIGKRWGGPKWPRSERRISGSVACFLMCVAIGAALLRPEYGWHGILLSALAATIAEAVTFRISDNISIPVAAAAVFAFCYPVF